MNKIKKMKNIVLLLFTIVLSYTASSQVDVKAQKLLDEVSEKMNNYENIYVEFNYKLHNAEEEVNQVTRGNVTLKDDLYNVNFLGVNQLFDGKKVYTIISEDEEVNISDADAEDAETLTPSKFFSFYKNGFTYSWDKLDNMNGRKIQYVKLIPIDSNSEISSVLLGVDVKTNHIYRLIETGNNSTVTTFKTNQPLSGKLFLFDETKYKKEGYLINRL